MLDMNLSSEYTEDIRFLPGRNPHKRGEFFMQKLSGRKLLLIGFTLFSMFFGAGNLIFPPDLGAKAGIHFWPAFLGLAISAVGLPVAGVVAVARAQGLEKLAGRVHPVFAQVFMILIYLSIGPCLAIPRTASTSFAMLAPLVGTGAGLQLGYSVVFFAAAFLVALQPEKLTRWLGRLLCPCLLVLILVLFGGCLLNPLAGQYGVPTPEYTSGAVLQGVLYGYQTMDTIAALNFGLVIATTLRSLGVEKKNDLIRYTTRAGLAAGTILSAVYLMLSYMGMKSSAVYAIPENGAVVLRLIVKQLFGDVGAVLLAAIFTLACLTTCVGLITSISQFFSSLTDRLKYRQWVYLIAGFSFVVCNQGLNTILGISVPVLNAIYPVSIVLIILGLLDEKLGKNPYMYPAVITVTGIVSCVYCLDYNMHMPLGFLSDLCHTFPLYSLGLGWAGAAAAAALMSHLAYRLRSRRVSQNETEAAA